MIRVILFLVLMFFKSLYSQTLFWEKTSTSQIDTTVSCLINTDNNNLIVANANGLYHSSDKGNSWTLKISTHWAERFHSICKTNDGYLYASKDYYGIFQSSDNGDTWINIGPISQAQIPIVSSNHLGDIYVGISGDGLFVGSDNFKLLKKIDSFPHSTILSFGVNSIGYLFGGSGNFGIFRSKDNGFTWEQTNSGLGNRDVLAIGIDSSDNIYLCTGNGIYKSSNNGDEWEIKNKGLSNLVVRCIAINQLDHIYVGTNDGVFFSKDNGENWTQINDGLTSFMITSLSFDNDGILFAGSWGGGVFRSTKSTTKIETSSNVIPKDFYLSNSFPNPFNPETKFHFSIPYYTYVKIIITNSIGELVDILVENDLYAGSYSIIWNASNYPSGVYFISMLTEKNTLTKKAVLVK